MREQEELIRFASGEPTQAQEAFSALAMRVRPFLHAYLRPRLAREADREDVVQEALVRLWKHRERYRFEGVAAWYALARRIAESCRIDLLRSQARAPTTELPPDDIADPEYRALDELLAALEHSLVTGRIRLEADRVFLDLADSATEEECRRQLLAMKLFYVDRVPWEDVLALLNLSRPAEAIVTREELDGWLADPALVRLLASRELYCTSEELAAWLLGVDAPGALSDWMCGGSGSSGTGMREGNDPDTFVTLCRIRHRMSVDQILSRSDCPVNGEALSGICDRLEARFPFVQWMLDLLHKLQPHPVEASAVLSGPGLWQRLAFEYWYFDQLSQKDLLAQVRPPAEEVGYAINAGVLNVWLSGGRLLRRVAKRLAPTAGNDDGPSR